MKMIDEMQDPLRQGTSVRFNDDGSVTVSKGRWRCSRCDTIPLVLHGAPTAPICHPCQVALYQVAYAAFIAARETPTYVGPPRWWARPVSPALLVVVAVVIYWLLGFLSASVWLGRAWP